MPVSANEIVVCNIRYCSLYRATSNEGASDWINIHSHQKPIERNLCHAENLPKERYWQQRLTCNNNNRLQSFKGLFI